MGVSALDAVDGGSGLFEMAPGSLIGREAELEQLDRLLDVARQGPAALVLEGSAGIGKSVVWSRALGLARERGYEVLSCRPGGAEVSLAFAALGDLVEPVADSVLPLLAEPRRSALEVALLERDGPPLSARAIGVAFLDVVRRLAGERPLLIGIDDLQWLDMPSLHALEFALRRVGEERVAVVVTERFEPGGSSPLRLEGVLGEERVTRWRVGPITVAAMHELLRLRSGAGLRRGTLVRVYEASEGNPLVALELVRELRRRGGDRELDEPLPVPGSLRELVGVRVRELPPPVRRVLLAAGALTRPTVGQLVRLERGAERALRVAAEAGIVELVGEGVRFTHPLLALVPYDELAPAARRRLHRRLSGVAASGEERARHAALSVSRADAAVAAGLDDAAESAGARGAPETAAELSALAARLTPWDAAGERWERTLNAAEWHERAGELESAAARAAEVLEGGAAAASSTRARALMLLGTIGGDIEGIDAARDLYLRALDACESAPQLRAEIHQKLAWTSLVGGQAATARRHARAALRLAPSDDPAVVAAAAATVALIEVARTGALPRRLLDRALALERSARATRLGVWGETAPSVLEGVTALWAGDLERARGPLEQMHATALESGDPWLLMHSLAYLSALETSLGDPREGLQLARRYLELASETEQDAQRAGALWPFAVAAATLGSVDEARNAIAVGLEIAERTGHRLYVLGCLAAQGELELSLGEFSSAAEVLWRARELARESGIVAVGRVSILPNAVEALLQVGEVQRAQGLIGDLEAHAAKVGRPWVVALAERSSGLAAAARGDWPAARQSFDQALSNHALQPRPLDRARTQLAFGAMLRRAGAKREARLAIESAEVAFAAAGATLWAERAEDELRRIGGRSAPAGSGLSATESRIAELVAAGRTNAETAQALRLSPRTVEWNLSKIYRKLSVRSRSELAATLRRSPG